MYYIENLSTKRVVVLLIENLLIHGFDIFVLF